MTDFQVVTQHPQLITYIDFLQKKNAEALSFYPKCVFERESEKGRLFLGLLNNQPCGYIYVGSRGGDVKCHQVCIEYDARRKLYGAVLVMAMEKYAKGSDTITLRCGFDLDANMFWKELGYKVINVVDGGIRRKRRINIWRKYVTDDLFSDFQVEPETGKTSATFWSKHKQTGLISQFHRGNSLLQYRQKLESETIVKPQDRIILTENNVVIPIDNLDIFGGE